MTPPPAGQPGHGSTAFLRNQPVRIVDGRMEGGYTGMYELICPSCGDHPYLDYTEVPPRLQRLRGPRTLEAILAVYHEHLGPCCPNEDSAGSSAWSAEAGGTIPMMGTPGPPDDGKFGTTDRSKTMSDADVELGPVDYVVVAFPAGKADFSGEMASELRALMDSGTVRVLDLVLLTKDADGSVEASELRDADDSEVGQLRAAEADLAVLLAASDVEEIGEVLEPGSTAAVLVWENTWAAPFGAAVRRSGGQLVTSGRIPTQAILAAIEADRAAQADGA